MEQGNELGIDLMAPAYNFMLFKIFSKNENATEAVYDLSLIHIFPTFLFTESMRR